MSFFGGGTDFRSYFEKYGGCVISTTFDKYCYVTVCDQPPYYNYNNQVTYSEIERTMTVDEIKHPAVRNTMQYLGLSNLRVTYEADLPAKSGLGSSSSFVVGMLNAFSKYRKASITKKELADGAIHIERELCGESGGWQDQIAVAFGGFNRIDFKPFQDGCEEHYVVKKIQMSEERKKNLESNLMLFFTGNTRFSFELSSKQEACTVSKNTELTKMKELVDRCESVLIDDNCSIDLFGELLHKSWQIKRNLVEGITTDSIDAAYVRAINAGAIGGKILGAGGGGFLLLYVPIESQNDVKNELKELRHVPFKFEKEGSKIIYYD